MAQNEAELAALTLARAVMATSAMREESYDLESGWYGLSFSAAAEKAGVDPSLRIVTSILLQTGFVDVPEWAEAVLEKQNELAMSVWAKVEQQADASTPIPLWPDIDLSDPVEMLEPAIQLALRRNENIHRAAHLSGAETQEAFRSRYAALAGDATVTAEDAAQIALILSAGPSLTRGDAFYAIEQWGRGLPSEVSPLEPREFQHFSALRAAGHDEDGFHAAFTRMEQDDAVSDKSLSRIAEAYSGIAQGGADRAEILGRIEVTFYEARAQASQSQQQGGQGR